MWRRSKWLSLLLAFSITFLAIAPQASFATTGSSQNSAPAASPQAIRSKGAKRVVELTDKRDQHTKFYLNSDGSTTAESSTNSRHYQDSQGKWQDISNKIVPSNESGFALRNEANSFQTHIANNSGANFLAKFKLDQNLSIAWNLNGAAKVPAINNSSSVTFPEIMPSTDLQYLPFSDGLTENIILKSSSAPNSFSFTLDTNGLTPVAQSDGSIALQDSKSNKTKLVLPKPYMYDKNGQESQSVSMVFTATKKPNEYTVNVTADLNWLGDPARAYPITIDPTVSTQNWYSQVGSNGYDTYVTSYAANTSYYNNNYLTTGYDSVNQGIAKSLIKFVLPTLPTGAIITDGVLSLDKYSTTSAPSEQLDALPVTSSWPYNVTWNTKPSVDTTNQYAQPGITNVAGNYTGWINFNVWTMAKNWINGTLANNGIEVVHNNESDPLFLYYSSNDPSGSGPLLSITYITDQTGLNPYWGYANTPVGSVNTYNGNLLSSVADFSLPGRGIPINVTRTYNNRGSLNGIFGQRWFSNLDMQLQVFNWGAVLIDSAGTERPFMLNSDGLTYTAPDNYPMQLYKTTSGGLTVYNVQEAVPGVTTYQSQLPTMTFNSSGQLIQLSDGKGNLTGISWSSGSITISDPSGRMATLSRNADGTVSQITTSLETGKVKASYTYSSGFLSSVTYDNGTYPSATVNYTWNSGYLSSLTDKNGTKQIINYNSNNQVISVGSVNMLSNPSLESSPDGSAVDNWLPTVSSDAGSIKQNTVAKYGRYGSDIQSVYQSGTSGTSYLYSTQKIPVSPNQTYTLSSLIKTANLGGSSTPNLSYAEAFLNTDQLGSTGNDLSIWNDSRASGVSGTTDWTSNNVTVTTSASTYYLVVYLEAQHDSAHFGGDAYFDGVQLEQGSTVSAFEGHTDFRYGTDNGYESVWVTSPSGELVEYKNDNYGTPVAVIQDPKNINLPKSETDMTWNAADQLLSLTTPNQVNSGSGKKYTYQYDIVGNMTQAKDPLSQTTNMNYYYNHLQNLTQADGSTVQHVWDPVNLNQDTSTDQTLNSQAYSYDSSGNVTTESNLLGVADNRVLNGSYEQLSGNQPVNWYAYTPTGTVANKVEYVTPAPFNDSNGGSNVLHINPGTNGNAYQWTDYLDLGGNTSESFTLSGYLKTAQTGTSGGACLNVYWYNASHTQVGSTQVLFNVRNTNWQHYVSTIQPPSGGASYAKVMAITYGSYDGYFDNIMFEKSQLARGYNFLDNSSFERQALQWSPSDSYSTVVNDGANAYSGSYDAQTNLPSVGSSYLESQTIVPVKPGQYYTLLGYMKTNNIVAGSGSGGARMHIYFYNSTGAYVNDYVIPLIKGTTGWTKYALPFSPPLNTATLKVRLEMSNAQGTAVFDNVRLSPGNLTVSSNYDPNKNYVTSTTDQLQNTINYNQDLYGQVKQVTAPSGAVTNYTYDGQERLRTVTDNAINTTTYNLDANGNVLNSSLVSGSNTYDNSTFTYDRHNNLSSEKDANNNTTNYSYDQDGRITQKTNPNGSSVSTAYDGYNNLSQLILSGGPTYNLGYDLEGHLTSSSTTNGPTMTYGYDAVGNMTSYVEKDTNSNPVTTIGAPSSGSMYSSLDQLLGFNLTYGSNTGSPITYNFGYTKSGLVSSVTINPGTYQKVVTFNYDENNNLVSRINPNNTQDNFTYNEANQVTGTQTVTNNNNVKWSSQYSYSGNDGKDGRLTSVTGTDPGTNSYSATYTYNNGTEKLDRLTQAVIIDGTYSGTFNYSNDPAGNLLTMDVANGTSSPNQQTFTYDADNRITNSGFGYDANGNLTSAVINGVSYQYVYDAANRLTTVENGSGTTIATYTYDSSGNRLTKTVGTTTTTYHYSNGQLWYESLNTDPSNLIHALYLRSTNGPLEAVSLNYTVGSTSNTWYYYHYNAHGDVDAVTDGNGNVYRQYVYDPYGNVISVKDGSGNSINMSTDSFNNAYLYAGYRYNQESGLYYLNARYYAPGIGRFLSKDSVLGIQKNPQTLNRYAYCGGDPVNRVDPSGSFWGWVFGGIAAVVVAVALLPEEISVAIGSVITTAISAISSFFSSPAATSVEDGAGAEAGSAVSEGTVEAAKSSGVQIFEKNASHIFREAPGHFSSDILENRKLLLDTAANKENFLGVDKYGSEWYAKSLNDETQVWTKVRNGHIENGGLNLVPRLFNSETGLSKR